MTHDLTIIILCGGMGTRLRPRTECIPKTLVPLCGKPMLEHILDAYLAKGFSRFVLCVGYLGHKISEFLEQRRFDADIRISDLGEQAGMLARIHAAMAHAGPRALVTYGDTLIDTDLQAMLAAHQARQAALTLTTASIKSPFGLIGMAGDHQVLSFEEKPTQTFYIGQMLVEGQALADVPEGFLRMHDGEGLILFFRSLIDQGRVIAFPYAGPQITFNTEQELKKAERDIITFYTQA